MWLYRWDTLNRGGNGFPHEQIAGGVEVSVSGSDINRVIHELSVCHSVCLDAKKNDIPHINTSII